MFGRGRGTPNHNDRRSGGNTQVKDFRNTPQHNRQQETKSELTTPSPQKKVEPPKKEANTPAGNKGGRARSRSPVDRSALSKKDPPVTTNNIPDNNAAEESQTDKKEDVKSFRYTGRPGEKKFGGRCRLFIANLGNTMTEDALKELFGEFGETGEAYVNKEKGFGFIRLDYRHNAEIAKLTLDKKLVNGRNIQIQYARHASAIELHGLDNFASNEFIEKSMSAFGNIERCVVVCDDRGRSKGYAVIEYEWKRSAAKVLDRLKDEMFALGRLPKPVFAKPYILTDEEDGIREESLERLDGLEQEREHQPRFISPNSFEYTWAKRWRDLFIAEQDKKARLEQEMIDGRVKLEFEMEAAIRQQESSKIREELARRQEELRMLEEDMTRRQDADMRILERSRQRELAARQGFAEPPPRDEAELYKNEMQLSRENAARQQDFAYLRQKAQMTLQKEPLPDVGMRSEIGYGGRGQQQQQQGGYSDGYPGRYAGNQQGGPRQMHSGDMDYRNQQRGPPRDIQQREMQHREFQQREQQGRGMPPRDFPQRDMRPNDMPYRDPPQRDLPANEPKSVEEKTADPLVGKAVVDPVNGPRR